MRIAHYYAHLLRGASGVTSAITWWSIAMADAGQEVVWATDANDLAGAKVMPFPVRSVRHTGRRRATAAPLDLGAVLGDCDLVYLHEGWTLSHLGAAWACRRAGLPYVVMPHGVYEPGIRDSLKPPARAREAGERWMLAHALAAHLFFDSEAALVHAIAPGARVLTAPTGAGPVEATWHGNGSADGRYVAWFGRYEAHHKGLDILLRGLASVPPQTRPSLRLRGYDYQGGKAAVIRLVDELGLRPWVEVGGEVRGDDKVAFVSQSQCYVHPSRWESHSIALIEVLQHGVPVLVSSSIHIARDLALARAAVLVEATPEAWGAALGEVFVHGVPEHMNERAVEFVRTRLTPESAVGAWSTQLRALGLPA